MWGWGVECVCVCVCVWCVFVFCKPYMQHSCCAAATLGTTNACGIGLGGDCGRGAPPKTLWKSAAFFPTRQCGSPEASFDRNGSGALDYASNLFRA
mmetsp:Transcript_92/g.201  ORF Transcript_92/g.201 Transcript_92/m.201 type:complete len:96 (+) Transcript_92:342-629(+)